MNARTRTVITLIVVAQVIAMLLIFPAYRDLASDLIATIF